MALTRPQPGQPVSVSSGAAVAEQKTVALFKSRDLEVIHLVLQTGQTLPPHQVPGEITLHCLEGRLELTLSDRMSSLAAGQLILLTGGEMHAITAVEPSSALV